MTAQDILLALAPCYGPPSPRLVALLDLSRGDLDPAVFGQYFEEAVALLTLHTLALSARGAAAATGAVTSETEGDLSRSYSAPAIIKSDLDATAWGQRFQRLGRSRTIGPRTRMG